MNPHRCQGVTRRSFLADTGMGFTGLALAALLYRDGSTFLVRHAETSPRGESDAVDSACLGNLQTLFMRRDQYPAYPFRSGVAACARQRGNIGRTIRAAVFQQ